MKRITLVTALLLGSIVAAHADTSTYAPTRRGGNTDLMSAAGYCDQRFGPVRNGEITPASYKKCMASYGWRYLSTAREHTWIDPDTGDTCHDILGGLGSSCGNF
jgi:hypothetical protein